VFWAAVGCIGCVTLPFLLIALFAGTLGGGIAFLTGQPVGVVRAQLSEIREGRLDAAYARLSDDYKARLTRTDFAALVEQHPALKVNQSASFFNRSRVNARVTLGGTLRARSGAEERATF
jgi:hypothetical protein